LARYGKNGKVGPVARISWNELECTDGTDVPRAYRDDAVVLGKALNKVRRRIAKHYKVKDTDVVLKINSGYRSPRYNRKIGGASNSQHLYARAADTQWYVKGKRLGNNAVANFAAQVKEFKRGGIGIYDPKHGNFVHLDVRGEYGFPPARWLNVG
jgi:uncharacterized protein YcbK (DUF882 family)